MRMREIMDRLNAALVEEAVPVISKQSALDAKMFGPVWHGTDHDMNEILAKGFDTQKSVPSGIGRNERPIDTSNGMPLTQYSHGLAAPIHWLGFGTYFTTKKAIAKQFAGGTARGMREFYLDVPRVETINWGSPNTMMKWWLSNGYTMTEEATQKRDVRAWVEATQALTDNLAANYDAVYYRGQSIRKLLDGDQICVFDPSRIHVIDPKLASGLDVGARVVHSQISPELARTRNDVYVDDITHDRRFVGWRGMFRSLDHDGNELSKENAFPLHYIPPRGMVGTIVQQRQGPNGPRYDVKWAKGGVQYNYSADELTPLS